MEHVVSTTRKTLKEQTDYKGWLSEHAGDIQAQQREAIHNNNANVLETTPLLTEMHMAHLMVRHCRILCGKLQQLSGHGLQHDVASVLLRSWPCAQQF